MSSRCYLTRLSRCFGGAMLGCLIVSGMVAPHRSDGATTTVSSIAALQTAINQAHPGDTVVLSDGVYTNGTLSIAASGITVRPETPGGAYLNGAQVITISGDGVTFSGFQFTSGDIGSDFLIEISGDNNLLTQLNVNGYLAQKYIRIQAGTVSNVISYCNIQNKPTNAVINCAIQINTSPSVPGFHKIQRCSFRNFPGLGGDYGNEPIRIGLSTEMTNVSRTLVEYCYFEDVGLGDSESISVKSTENLCRYNTFTNNPQGMLVFRHGYRNVAYGNFFIGGSGGIRIKEGADHFVYNNYFQTGVAAALTLQYVAEFPLANINILHNTFYNSGLIDLGGTGITAVTFANNIFKKGSGAIFGNSNGATSWAGNIYNGTLGITKPASGLTSADAGLVLNSEGYYGLSSASPAIDAASSSYPPVLDIPGMDDDPLLLLDISGQPRPGNATLKDLGCDEFVAGLTTNRPLALSDVGPSYLGGPGALAPVIVAQPQSQSVSVGSPVAFYVVATNTGPLRYQWRKDGANLLGATASSYSLVSARTEDAGGYSVVVTNIAGSATSTVATLTVNAPLVRTNLILDDRWLDGSRTNTSLPTDAAWHANNPASLVAATNNLLASPDAASTLTWWSYFTTNLAGPVALSVSDILRVTLAFTPSGVNWNNTSRGLRLGLFDSSGGARTVVDGANPNGANVKGYMFNMNIGQTFAGNPTMQFMERTNLPSSNLIGTVNDYAAMSSGGPMAGSPGLSNGVPYLLELVVTRGATSVNLTATVSNTNGWSVSLSAIDTNQTTFAFDTFVFRPALQSQTMTNFAFSRFKVELVSTNIVSPVPPTITNQPASLTVSAGSAATFTAGAAGDAPLAYQWRFNGANISDATTTSYSLVSAQAANAGTYTVVVTNAAGSITSAVATLTVLIAPPQIKSLVHHADGDFTFSGTGPVGEPYRILSTTNLLMPVTAWPVVDTGHFTGGVFNFIDHQSTNFTRRFYQVVTP